MSDEQAVIYLICGAMIVHAFTNKKHFSFYIYKDCFIENKTIYRIEKILMIVFPLIVTFLYTFFQFHPFVIRLWLDLIILFDFALQYFFKECGWLNINKDAKVSKTIIMWIIMIVAIFFTIKS